MRLRNLVEKNDLRGFRAVLFRMVPKRIDCSLLQDVSFRAVLFRMVPKRVDLSFGVLLRFRAVLFRMVPKRLQVRK